MGFPLAVVLLDVRSVVRACELLLGADAGRLAGRDDVARLQRRVLRQVGNEMLDHRQVKPQHLYLALGITLN